MGVGPKQDGGMTENLQRIAAAHPGSALADRYGGEPTKQQKTRYQCLKSMVLSSINRIDAGEISNFSKGRTVSTQAGKSIRPCIRGGSAPPSYFKDL